MDRHHVGVPECRVCTPRTVYGAPQSSSPNRRLPTGPEVESIEYIFLGELNIAESESYIEEFFSGRFVGSGRSAKSTKTTFVRHLRGIESFFGQHNWCFIDFLSVY